MQKFDTHLCLVSAQTIPNLIPLLAPDSAPKTVVLAVTQAMQQQADWLESVIKRKGIQVERLNIPDAYDYHGIEEIFLNWLGEHEQCDVALNVTGGTKLMAMAAQDVFRAEGKTVFYVNVETDDVILLGNRESGGRLPSKIKLRDYLESYGYQIEGKIEKPNLTAEQKQLGEALITGIKNYAAPLGSLNYLAGQAKKTKTLRVRLDARQSNDYSLRKLIEQFANQLAFNETTAELTFNNESARQFVNGGWLENHVYNALSDLAPTLGVHDYALNLKVLAPDGKTRNEIDVAFLYRNALYLIECKAANLGASSKADDTNGTDAVYKLDTLHKLGGLRTHTMLIDYLGKLNAADKQRAKNARIDTISGTDLLGLKEKIRVWLQPHKS